MKGPGFRYDLDIRRVWECPKCGKRLRCLGHVTSRRCRCDEAGHWMRIVEERFRRTFPEREKIVIPEEEPQAEVTQAEEVTSHSVEPEPVDSALATDTAEPLPAADAGPPVEETPPQPASMDAQPSPPSDSESEEPRRKKRRKKRRRKKNRGRKPEASDNQESDPHKGSQSGSEKDDFGTTV